MNRASLRWIRAVQVPVFELQNKPGEMSRFRVIQPVSAEPRRAHVAVKVENSASLPIFQDTSGRIGYSRSSQHVKLLLNLDYIIQTVAFWRRRKINYEAILEARSRCSNRL